MMHGRQRLREWLRRSLMSQRDFAAKISVSDGYLSQMLSGNRRPKLEMLMTIEAETGVPVESWAELRHGKSVNSAKAFAK